VLVSALVYVVVFGDTSRSRAYGHGQRSLMVSCTIYAFLFYRLFTPALPGWRLIQNLDLI
jgi:hypothetical protein